MPKIDFVKEAKTNIWLPYTQMQIAPEQLEVVSTKGVKIKLKDGRELIDGIASWWSVAHGYNHPQLIKAIKNQAKSLSHIMLAGLANQETYKLAYNLAKITPQKLKRVFFSDSGSTAVEVAMKIAIQFFLNQNKLSKTKIIAFENSYHGDTFGAMSLADLERGMHHKFKNCLPQNYNLALPNNQNQLNQLEDFIKKHQEQLAAIIIEPMVQCAGGMKFHSASILKSIYDLAKKYQLLFIADECATGFYRTGKLFACDHADITPDIMVVGKALTGGMIGMAATITSEEIFEQFLSSDLNKALMHGPTFMGNPLACSAANASLELFTKNNYQEKVTKISHIFEQELPKFRKLKDVVDVRWLGAIGVIETNYDWQKIFSLRQELVAKGVWLRPFAGVIYIMPPLIIEKQELRKIIQAIWELISDDKIKSG